MWNTVWIVSLITKGDVFTSLYSTRYAAHQLFLDLINLIKEKYPTAIMSTNNLLGGKGDAYCVIKDLDMQVTLTKHYVGKFYKQEDLEEIKNEI